MCSQLCWLILKFDTLGIQQLYHVKLLVYYIIITRDARVNTLRYLKRTTPTCAIPISYIYVTTSLSRINSINSFWLRKQYERALLQKFLNKLKIPKFAEACEQKMIESTMKCTKRRVEGCIRIMHPECMYVCIRNSF